MIRVSEPSNEVFLAHTFLNYQEPSIQAGTWWLFFHLCSHPPLCSATFTNWPRNVWWSKHCPALLPACSVWGVALIFFSFFRCFWLSQTFAVWEFGVASWIVTRNSESLWQDLQVPFLGTCRKPALLAVVRPALQRGATWKDVSDMEQCVGTLMTKGDRERWPSLWLSLPWTQTACTFGCLV